MDIQFTSEISVEEIQQVGDDRIIAHSAMVSTRGNSQLLVGDDKTNGQVKNGD